MNKKEFIKRRIPYNEHMSGPIRLHTLDKLPDGVKPLEDINDMLDHTGSIAIDLVYFLRNIEDKFYFELTNKDTNLELIEQHIKRGNTIYL